MSNYGNDTDQTYQREYQHGNHNERDRSYDWRIVLGVVFVVLGMICVGSVSYGITSITYDNNIHHLYTPTICNAVSLMLVSPMLCDYSNSTLSLYASPPPLTTTTTPTNTDGLSNCWIYYWHIFAGSPFNSHFIYTLLWHPSSSNVMLTNMSQVLAHADMWQEEHRAVDCWVQLEKQFIATIAFKSDFEGVSHVKLAVVFIIVGFGGIITIIAIVGVHGFARVCKRRKYKQLLL